MGAGQAGAGVSPALANGLAAAAAANTEADLKPMFAQLSEADRQKFKKALDDLKTPRSAKEQAGASPPEAKAEASTEAEAPAEAEAQAPAEAKVEAPAEAPTEANAEAPAEAPAGDKAEPPAQAAAPAEAQADAPASTGGGEDEDKDPDGVLSADQLKLVRATFNRCDTNNSGAIEVGELKTMLKELGQELSDEDVQTVFTNLDLNKDGKLQFSEYRSMVSMVMSGKSVG